MNPLLSEYQRSIRGKNVAVLGLGISNTPLIEFLCRAGARVTAFDRAEAAQLSDRLARLDGLDVRYVLGPDYLRELTGFDVVFKTPQIRPDIPELLAERARGATVTSEMEVFIDLCPSVIFGVTGSDGKTTTTTLIYEMLKAHGYVCHLGGNIGRPLLADVASIAPSDMTILELSSFQLMTLRKSPDVAVITNLSPNHLDVHKSYDEYVGAKKNIFAHQTADGLCVLNLGNADTRRLRPLARGRLGVFCADAAAGDYDADGDNTRGADGSGNSGNSGNSARPHVAAFVRDGHIILRRSGREKEIMRTDDILLPGPHNIENYLAAICAVERYVDVTDMLNVARNFKGVEHRIEHVRTLGGVSFYNDSIASSPTRTIACLNTFPQPVILIAGGKDKNLDFLPLGPWLAKKVKLLILCGQTSGKIKNALNAYREASGLPGGPDIIECDSYEHAVASAWKAATPGDIAVLSPASTSFDRFRNFEERGNAYKALVNALKE